MAASMSPRREARRNGASALWTEIRARHLAHPGAAPKTTAAPAGFSQNGEAGSIGALENSRPPQGCGIKYGGKGIRGAGRGEHGMHKRSRNRNAGYYEVLQVQQQLYPAQIALVQTQLNELLALVQLYRALGGGWNE
jgi:hypothetical protein